MPTLHTETGFLGEAGARLYYEVAGEGQPLILLHAGIADSRMWDEQFDFFAQNYRVVRYDLRGYGQSEVPAAEFAQHEDLANLLRHLQISQAHILGISFGGLVALDFALAYPEMVSTLILTAPSVSGRPTSRRVKQFQAEEDTYMTQGDLAGATELNLRFWVDGPTRTPDQVSATVRERVRQMQMHAFTIPEPAGAEMLSLTPPAYTRLTELHAPTLIIVGDIDIPDKIALANELYTAIAGAQQVIIPDVAHMVSMEKPDEFNHIVSKFLQNR